MNQEQQNIVDQALLQVSEKAINNYSQMPPEIQDKLREKIFLILEWKHPEILPTDSHNKPHSLYQTASRALPNSRPSSKSSGKKLSTPSSSLLSLVNQLENTKDPELQKTLEKIKKLNSDFEALPESQNSGSFSEINSVSTQKPEEEPGSTEELQDTSHSQGHFNFPLPVNQFSDGLFQPVGTDNIRLEITTTREALITAAGCSSFIGFLFLFANGYLFGGFLLLFIAYKSKKKMDVTDDFVMIDPNRREIYMSINDGKIEKKEFLCDFNSILYFAVDGQKHQNKNSTWWNYGIVVCKKDGRKIAISDYKKVYFDLAYEFCKALGKRFSLPVLEGEEEGRLESGYDGVRTYFYYVKG